jgi:hypothetical protein
MIRKLCCQLLGLVLTVAGCAGPLTMERAHVLGCEEAAAHAAAVRGRRDVAWSRPIGKDGEACSAMLRNPVTGVFTFVIVPRRPR